MNNNPIATAAAAATLKEFARDMKLYNSRFHGCRVNEFFWRGHRLIVLENEKLRVGVLASKGADIIEFRYKPRDLDVLWHAPQTLLPGEYVPTAARQQGAFLDYYIGGWQEIFPSAGPATEIAGAVQGQHGEISLLPWDVAVLCDRPDRIEVEFTVETVRTPFRLIRRMILESNSPVLRLEEKFTNLGKQSLPFAWGHHPAFGPPFLEPGCVIELMPCEGFLSGTKVPGPETATESVGLCTNFTDGWCALRNPAQGLAVGMVWDRQTFPYMWVWQVYGGAKDYPYYGRTYNLALEPFNCPFTPMQESIVKGLIPEIGAGASAETELECGIYEVDKPIVSLGKGGLVNG